jgi:hypothetical protein
VAKETEDRVLARMKEEADREKLSAEERLKGDLTVEKTRATKAENAAAEARAQSDFYRTLARSGLVPQDEMAEVMVWEAAKVKAGEGKPVTAAVIKELATEKTWLFKAAAAAPAGAAPTTNPAEVLASRSLTTQPAGPAGGGGGGPTLTPENAFDMSKEQWEAFKKKHGPHGR